MIYLLLALVLEILRVVQLKSRVLVVVELLQAAELEEDGTAGATRGELNR